MAEAQVETPPTSNKFFCHRCNVEIPRVLPGFKCPECQSGFIEEMESQPQNSFSDDSSDDGDVEMVASIGELLSQSIFSSLRESAASASADASSGSSTAAAPNSDGGNATRRRRQAGTYSIPVRSTRRRTSNDRPMAPLENILQEFIINLSGFDWDPAAMQAQGSPMFMYGNPGDYAFGRAGLDTIITQLLNQMDGTGPPPMTKDKIAQIPTVTVEQHQVDQNLQCSVCWEDFKLAEPVRKLVCDHFYHAQCIVPWLQLHSTCPICRKALNEETPGTETGASSSSSASAPGPSFSSSSNNSSGGSSSGTSWFANASQSGPRIFQSFLGSITNVLNGGGTTSSPSSSSSSGSSSSSQQQQQDGSTPSSLSPRQHRYNLRSRERQGQDSNEEDDSNGSARTQRSNTGQGRGRRFQSNFEDDYD